MRRRIAPLLLAQAVVFLGCDVVVPDPRSTGSGARDDSDFRKFLNEEYKDGKTQYTDPGTGAWERVPASEVLQRCQLDPAALKQADQKLGRAYVIVRHGRLCHEHGTSTDQSTMIHSVTKTLGAVTAGMVAHDTRDLPGTGHGTGPFSDGDPVSHWLTTFSYNKSARVSHVLAMVAHNHDLGYGQKSFKYDLVGSNQINTLSKMLDTAIKQTKGKLARDLDDYVTRRVFQRLGMKQSSWMKGKASKAFATLLYSTVKDMARLGLLILNKGVWSSQRLVSKEWIYRMTHPAYEDANTGFGYLTWLNAADNWKDIMSFGTKSARDIRCAPLALHPGYPSPVSGAPDCNYKTSPCTAKHDVGVWLARGTGGQWIIGHPGLDMVMAIKGHQGRPNDFWQAVLPAVVKGDSKYKGDRAAFCKDYERNNYVAPVVSYTPKKPGDGGGSGGQPPAPGVTDYTKSGPFTVKKEQAVGPKQGYTLYYPAAKGAAPALIWGNATFTKPSMYDKLLNFMASHGFFVIATNDSFTRQGATMIGGIEWLVKEAQSPSSAYYKAIDPNRVGVFGHSQGGASSLVVAAKHSRIKATVALMPDCNFWVKCGDAKQITTPVLSVAGGKDALVPAKTVKSNAFTNVQGSAVYALNKSCGHFKWMSNPLELMAEPVLAYFRYHLMGDKAALSVFSGGASSKLAQSGKWTVEQK